MKPAPDVFWIKSKRVAAEVEGRLSVCPRPRPAILATTNIEEASPHRGQFWKTVQKAMQTSTSTLGRQITTRDLRSW